MNALQQLIQEFIDNHANEDYSTIARRGEMPRQTVWAIARRRQHQQTIRPATIRKLARGLQTSESVIREAAGLSAGYGATTREGDVAAVDTDEWQLLLATLRDLDPERLHAVERRARALHREMLEEEQARQDRKGK